MLDRYVCFSINNTLTIYVHFRSYILYNGRPLHLRNVFNILFYVYVSLKIEVKNQKSLTYLTSKPLTLYNPFIPSF